MHRHHRQACWNESGRVNSNATASHFLPAVLLDAPDDLDEINRLYRAKRWCDGLPIVPPTPARVARMLEGADGRDRNDIVALLAPAFNAATIERIAINAVMAGCDASLMPPLLAA